MTDSSGARRRRRGFGSLRAVSSLGGVAALAVVGIVVAMLAGWHLSLSNPFAQHTVDRSPPAVLKSLENLHSYHGASAHIEVVVDLDQEAKFLPSSLRGQRTLFVGVGTVDAAVDFSKLGSSAVTVSTDRRTASIVLPHATLSEPRVDVKKSHVVARQQGLLNRLGNFFGGGTNDQKVYALAADKMTAAAKADGSVLPLAEQNTASMLKGLLGALGFTTVTVTFNGNNAG
jgi:Protein of unknown function (DUF4230)